MEQMKGEGYSSDNAARRKNVPLEICSETFDAMLLAEARSTPGLDCPGRELKRNSLRMEFFAQQNKRCHAMNWIQR